MKNNRIIPYKHPVSEIDYKIPKAAQEQYKGTITAINNAWKNSTYLDDYGQVWVETIKLHSILRTNKGNAKYKVASISDEHKIIMGNKTYIRGYEVIRLIDKAIEECGIGTKAEYLRYSEKNYNAIRDSDKGNLLRELVEKNRTKLKKTLKKKRIKLKKVAIDELTGEVLNKRKSDFSHIRSCSMYPYLADNINNGLVVNKETHKIITEKNINDEDELFDLCKNLGWRLKWYDEYIKIIK